jgi:predicted O-methyltransferase YrrM
MAAAVMTAALPETIPVAHQIERMVDGVPGWTPHDELMALFTLAYTTPIAGDIIELGSWCGRSASALGLAAKLTGHTTVYAVDLFPAKTDWRRNGDGSYSFAVTLGGTRVGGYEEQTVWAEPYLRDIAPIYDRYHSVLDVFRETVTRNHLDAVVRPFHGNSDMFATAAPADLRCKLAFIDGDHSYAAVCDDISRIERFLVPGAWICFDDAFSSYEGVDRAIRDRIIDSGRYECCHQFTRKLFVARLKADR